MSEIGFHDAGVEYDDDFDAPDPYDAYCDECEALGIDPMSALAPYFIEQARWDFRPTPPDFLPDYDPEDIPF